MTNSQKILIIKLLQGHFLKLVTDRGRIEYKLYDEKFNPVERVKEKTVATIDRFIDPAIKIWKSDKYGRMTLNLSGVRQLHGKSILKQYYKKRNNLEETTRIYKARNNRKKIKQTTDEKVNYLF